VKSQPAAQTGVNPQTKGELVGIPASPGIAIAPVTLYAHSLKVLERPVDDRLNGNVYRQQFKRRNRKFKRCDRELRPNR